MTMRSLWRVQLFVWTTAVATLIVLLVPATAQEIPTASGPPDLSQPHAFGVHDMLRMDRLGTPQPSPDGQRVVFTVRSWDPESNKTTTNLWTVSADGAKPRQLTAAKGQS